MRRQDSSGYYTMTDRDLWRLIECLVNDAIAFGQTEQRSELLFGRVSVQIEMQSNLLEADSNVFGHSQSAAKIEVAFRPNRCVSYRDAESRSDCTQRNATSAATTSSV